MKANVTSILDVFYTFDSPYQVNISRYNPPMNTTIILDVSLLFKLRTCHMLETSKLLNYDFGVASWLFNSSKKFPH